MKKIILIIAGIFLFGLGSCSNEIEEIFTPSDEGTAAEISPAVVSGGNFYRTSITNLNETGKEYLVTFNPSWCRYVTKTGGFFTISTNYTKGYIDVKITSGLGSLLSQSGSINFYDRQGGTLLGTVTVRQQSFGTYHVVYGRVSPDYIYMGYVDTKPRTFNFEINTPSSNVWQIVTPSHITVNRTSGTGTANITATVRSYEALNSKRQSDIRIIMNGGAYEFKVGVDQKGPVGILPAISE